MPNSDDIIKTLERIDILKENYLQKGVSPSVINRLDEISNMYYAMLKDEEIEEPQTEIIPEYEKGRIVTHNGRTFREW
jgi:hypothetical protein